MFILHVSFDFRANELLSAVYRFAPVLRKPHLFCTIGSKVASGSADFKELEEIDRRINELGFGTNL